MKRPEEIKREYIHLIERHLDELIRNKAGKMFGIEDFSRMLFVHPTHLSNTIKEATGTSACGIYQLKIMEMALRLLADTSLSIKDIALLLTYEPSQFTKWFKRIINLTPKQYRLKLSSLGPMRVNSETMTILKRYSDIPLCF
ncbi:helix-turn-helix domain-containing protein [Hufsiella ginkgonis]|uniref:Helix-turn-helix domain-containing protein n=1 Tax=Hufsiella ginkgonis TaxID=2695274 RepID=A0A7K1XVN8_9SPHI|nr:AraC family transcriptional regulator [Hufsiella ginkgonis]MXV15042.1 helix-turn-helix domain-containing protein [Hufsiella ginkgonis]